LFVDAVHADPPVHTPPAQQSCPLPPHTTQSVVALSQTNGSPQKLPPPSSGQHACPSPPHSTHALLEPHVSNGAVQPTPLPQHACPIFPHVPPAPPLLVQVPPLENVPPDATHTFAL
jgi:hypothetical protein